MTLNIPINGVWARVTPPTPEQPWWHEEDGTRLAIGDAVAGAPERLHEIQDAHVHAIADVMHASFEAQGHGDHKEQRRLAIAAGRLANETIGLFPAHAVQPR